jgi:hypothetical protein
MHETGINAMPTPRTHHQADASKPAPPSEDLNDELDSLADEESAGLDELSFDDDSRSDRHQAIGNEQSAQNDNAPDADIDELSDGNDIGEQGEDR